MNSCTLNYRDHTIQITSAKGPVTASDVLAAAAVPKRTKKNTLEKKGAVQDWFRQLTAVYKLPTTTPVGMKGQTACMH